MTEENRTTENSSTNSIVPPQTVIVKSGKSMGLAIILTVLFGPLGLLYATIKGGIILILLALVIGILTLGFGALITWPVSIIWAVIAVKAANKRE